MAESIVPSLNSLTLNPSPVQVVNNRIQKEICLDTIEKLSDQNMLELFKSAKSTKKNIAELRNVLTKNKVSTKKQDKIIDDYILKIISAGAKGVIRGNKFNKIIEEKIISFGLPSARFDVQFEKHHESFKSSEIPDWYIYDKNNKKIIIGMNQLALWGGGQQSNRGSKYVLEANNTEHCKLLAVVCNNITVKSKKSKVFNLFEKGFEQNTLCYINGIESIVKEYFNLE